MSQETWVVISDYREDHYMTSRVDIQQVTESQEEAERIAGELQATRGFEKSDGGDGIEAQSYRAVRASLIGKTVTKTLVTTTETKYSIGEKIMATSRRTEESLEPKVSSWLSTDYIGDFQDI